MGMLLILILNLMISIVIQSRRISAQSLPGCPNKCKNVTIPYPFGTREGCYLNELYFVNCKNLRIFNTSIQVLEISPDGHMRGLLPISYRCYNERGFENGSEPRIWLSRFPLSSLQNVLTTVGCDARANMKVAYGEDYITGCLTNTGCNMITNGSCLSLGCSQISVPMNVTSFRIHTQDNTNMNVGKWRFNNCTYGFLVEKDSYTFSATDLYNMQKQSFPVSFIWTVGNTGCEEAQANPTTYVCAENSVCVDDIIGYRCQCAQGYQGNAYLPNGCQDVNECEDALLHSCTHICKNTVGNHTCHCPKGYSGDGLKDGTRCTKNRTSAQKLGIYMGISMGIVVTSITMFLSYCFLKQRRLAKQKEMIFKRNGGKIFEKILSESEGSTQIVKIFTEDELKKATKNFSPYNVVGQGGFGTVYKGILIDNTVVAIKKSKVIDPNQIGQFVNEVVLLSQINHPNIVKLVGCCLETDVPLLAYEYIVNDTLFHHLHGTSRGSLLSWRMRLKIALETAGAIAYMHSATKIIHRDIKSSNILLNDDYSAKVSDFGISRSIPKNKMEVSTAVQGTLGYIDPEYFISGILTGKSDVYSFGVVLMELLTGEKVNSAIGTRTYQSLVDHFVLLLKEDRLFEILDDQVKLDATHDQLNRVAHLVKSCVSPQAMARPTMEEVKQELLALQEIFGLPHTDKEIVSFCSTGSYVTEPSSSQMF
uniref:wall-associated receptor kinase 3-like n=1 Tax=Erigeron canadensis TaxID=72917 RepID=UPI001CB88E3B|nr:wall-associated receptor kinase 3-like [Erigeron canadensis]